MLEVWDQGVTRLGSSWGVSGRMCSFLVVCWPSLASIPWLIGVSFWSLASSSRGILPVCAYVQFLLLLRTLSCWIKAHSNDLILMRLTLEKPYLQIRSHSEVLRISISIHEFGRGGYSLTKNNLISKTRRKGVLVNLIFFKNSRIKESSKLWWKLWFQLFRSTTLNNLFLHVDLLAVHCPLYKDSFERFRLWLSIKKNIGPLVPFK